MQTSGSLSPTVTGFSLVPYSPSLLSWQLLTTQGVSCAHIYSALDQTARKINLAKFTHGKCSVLLVTDLAARGLDIPLLDNVVNYSFPAKGKLFLHRVGEAPTAPSPETGQRVPLTQTGPGPPIQAHSLSLLLPRAGTCP